MYIVPFELKCFDISDPHLWQFGISLTGARCTESATPQALTKEHALLRDSPVLSAKAAKNAVEAAGMMEGHKRDAFTLVKFLAQLEDEVEVSGVQTSCPRSGRRSP